MGQHQCPRKWPFRGSERTFFPLRGLREGGLFIAKGAAREKQASIFLSFHPIIPFCCTLSDPDTRVESCPVDPSCHRCLAAGPPLSPVCAVCGSGCRAGSRDTHQTSHKLTLCCLLTLLTAQTAHTPLCPLRATRALTQTMARWTHSTARGYALMGSTGHSTHKQSFRNSRKYVIELPTGDATPRPTAQRRARMKSNEEAYCEANECAHLRLSLAQI